MVWIWMMIVIFVICVICVWMRSSGRFEQIGGDRIGVYQHWDYKPDYPYISQFHTTSHKTINKRDYQLLYPRYGTWENLWYFPHGKTSTTLGSISGK